MRGGAMVRVDKVMKRMYECVGGDMGWKGRGREAEKRMILEASCDPL